MECCHLAVHVNLQRYCVRLPTVPATGQSQEGNCPVIQFKIMNSCFLGRYLERLESQLAEQTRLQSRINELEAKLREFDPSVNTSTTSNTVQQFLTSPEISNTQPQSSTYLSPIHSQSHSPPCPNYSDADAPTVSSVYPGDHDANTDPGVFEAGDAGKGWYLGAASGSKFFDWSPDSLVIYMNSIKNTASSGNSYLCSLLILVLGIELDLSEFSPLSKSVSGKSMPSLLSELHSHRSNKPSKPLLPPKELGIELANDFFATINLLCPLLHRPSFYREVQICHFVGLIISSTGVIATQHTLPVVRSLSNIT